MVCLALLAKKAILKRNIPLLRYCVKHGVDFDVEVLSKYQFSILYTNVLLTSLAVDVYVNLWIDPNKHSIAFKMLHLVFKNSNGLSRRRSSSSFHTPFDIRSPFDKFHYEYYNDDSDFLPHFRVQRAQHVKKGLDLLHYYIGYDTDCECTK
jgi:hypothetical protein